MIKKIFFLVFISVIVFSCSNDENIFQLVETLNKWQYRGNDQIWRKTYIPNSIQNTLLKDTLIDNVFFSPDLNNHTWTDTVAWEYRTNINITSSDKKYNQILVFKGIIGIADIYLNDSLLFRADNMFRVWQYDISKLTKRGANQLIVKFISINKTLESYKKSSKFTYPFNGMEQFRISSCFSDTVRGLYCIPTGFWKNCYLIKWRKTYIKNVHYSLVDLKYNEYAKIRADFEIVTDDNSNYTLLIKDKKITYFKKRLSLSKGENNVSVEFTIQTPQLWWNYELGNPFLYNLTSTLENNSIVYSSKEVDFGVRKLTIDTSNHNFIVKINDVPIVLKIMNYSPISTFYDKVYAEDYDKVITNLKFANINMLHIWEGGLYEDDIFYQKCDKNGILIWHDFMLPYKISDNSDDFYKNIEIETIEIIKRLRNYSSIIFWSGQNFVEKYWKKYIKNESFSNQDSIELLKFNDKIFKKLLPNIIVTYDSGTYYFEKMDFVSIVSINDLLPGFPHFVLIKKIYNQSDKQITSPILKKYSRPLHTIDLIINEMRKTKLNPSYLSGFMYYNGVLTSQMFENKILPFRFDYKYNGYICGFYNDYAPVISKSAVDFNGIWKAKMFSVKRIFEKLQFKITENSGKVDVFIRSDFTENITVDFYFKLYNLKGNVVWRKNFYNISIKSNSFQNYFNFNFLNELNKTKRNNTVLKIEVYYDKELFSEKYHYFVPDDELKLIAPNINKKYFRIDDGYVIELTTDYLAKNVYIYTEKDGILSDNYFDIIPGETKKIIYYTKTDIYAIESVFKISSFTDIYNFGLFSL